MITGSRVRLRAIERSDLPTFVRWFNDPEVCRFLGRNQPMSLAEEERWFDGLPDRGGYVFAIEALVDDEWLHVGNCGLHDLDHRHAHAELGIMLGEKEHWGKGFGTEAVRLLLRFAFDQLNLHRVQLHYFAGNERGRRCYERVGFQHEGVKREALFRDGRYQDVYLMSILRDEFHAAEEAG